MNVFTLLGYILDQDVEKEEADGIVTVTIDDSEVIARIIAPICNAYTDEYITGSWYQAKLTFGKNLYCNKGEIKSITFEDSYRESLTCEIGEDILDNLTDDVMDDIYFEMCDKIMF